jgi:glucose-1-phosphate thymidylyltransferase
MMKALILCGGFATRLNPITYFVPKALLPIGAEGKPIIEYILDDMMACGINDIVLSTNAKFMGNFNYWAKNILDKRNVKIDFVVEETMNNRDKFGQIKGISYAIEQGRIDTDLIIVAGDNFYDFSIKDAIEVFKKYKRPVAGLYNLSSIEDAKKFGVVSLKNNMISAFEEKPKAPKSTLVSTGIYVFPKESLGEFDEYLKAGNNPDGVGNFVKWLSEKGEVVGHVYRGKWYDIGTLETYRKAFDEYSKK